MTLWLKALTFFQRPECCVLVFFFFLTACSDPTTIRPKVDGLDADLEVEVIDTLTAQTSLILLDSVSTSAIGQFNIGGYDDNYLGYTRADAFLQIRPASATTRIADGAVFDSMTVVFPYQSFFGDTGQTQQFEVYTLTDTLNERTNYFGFSKKTFNPTPIDTAFYKVSFFRANAVRFRLDAYGRELLTAGNPILTDITAFNNAFKGLYLKTIGDPKATVRLGLTGGARATIHYHTSADSTPRLYSMTVNANCPHFTSYRVDKAGKPSEALRKTGDIIPTSATGNRIMTQAGVGVRTIIRFPGLSVLKQQLGSRLNVVKAEIINEMEGNPTILPSMGVIFFRNSEKNRTQKDSRTGFDKTVPNEQSKVFGGFSFNFPLNTELGNYKFEVTTYARQVINGQADNYGIIMGNQGAGLHSEKIRMKDSNPSNGSGRLRLRIYYLK